MGLQRQAKPSNGVVARKLLNKGVLHPHSLAKYAAAFKDASLRWHLLLLGAEVARLGTLMVLVSALLLWLGIALNAGRLARSKKMRIVVDGRI